MLKEFPMTYTCVENPQRWVRFHQAMSHPLPVFSPKRSVQLRNVSGQHGSWFPRDLWAEMNQTWAGLGQLLNNNKHKQTMAAYIDNKVSNFDSPWRVVDKEKFMLLLEVYRNK
jgi:hypothetical protein